MLTMIQALIGVAMLAWSIYYFTGYRPFESSGFHSIVYSPTTYIVMGVFQVFAGGLMVFDALRPGVLHRALAIYPTLFGLAMLTINRAFFVGTSFMGWMTFFLLFCIVGLFSLRSDSD